MRPFPDHVRNELAPGPAGATKSGNGLQKTSNTFSIYLLIIYLLFFYFSVVLVVRREKALEIKVFPGNWVGNGIATK